MQDNYSVNACHLSTPPPRTTTITTTTESEQAADRNAFDRRFPAPSSMEFRPWFDAFRCPE